MDRVYMKKALKLTEKMMWLDESSNPLVGVQSSLKMETSSVKATMKNSATIMRKLMPSIVLRSKQKVRPFT